MKLFHGTILKSAKKIITKGIIITEGRVSTDFGQGFYTTNNEEYAIMTALKRAKYKNTIPAVIELEYKPIDSLSVLTFLDETLDWLQFIINNRNGLEYLKNINTDINFHNLDKKYDVVSGPIADKDIVKYTKKLLAENKKATYNDVKKIKYDYSTSQTSFHTEKVLQCLEIIKINQVR